MSFQCQPSENSRDNLYFPSIQVEVEGSCLGPGEDSISFLPSLVPCTLLTSYCISFTWQQKSSIKYTSPISSRCEELHPPLGAQPQPTPQTFWGSCSSWCWEVYPVPISRSVCCNFKHLKPL